MLIKTRKSWELPESAVTPHSHYINRRHFMRGGVAIAGGALLAGVGCRPPLETTGAIDPQSSSQTVADDAGAVAVAETAVSSAAGVTDELDNPLTPFEQVTGYNNFYEFTTDKEDVAAKSKGFVTSPWQIEVDGLVNNPRTFDLDDLLAFEQEERIYRLRCVEAWSMVIPWLGFPLSKILAQVEPTSDAKYVAFQTLDDPEQFPGVGGLFSPYDWPYKEGLRLDEAMNELTLMATGLYGDSLLPQNGAPIRLVVPWKYGFKSIKSIVKITLVSEQPPTLWNTAASNEYGFYANVNPNVSHPRWTQASERIVDATGGSRRKPTLMFNGYEEQVSSLYSDMDLAVNF